VSRVDREEERDVTDRPRIWCLHRLPRTVEARLEAEFDVEWNRDDGAIADDELVSRAGEFDGLLTTVTDPVPAAVFRAAGRRVRIVANFGVGVDRIDLAAARSAGVVVTNTPGVLTDCTADLTLALILMTLRRLGEGERLLRRGQWTGWRPTHHLGRRVSGRTLGIIGMGRIGQAVAARARHGFNMSILYASRTPLAPEVAARLGAMRCEVDQLLERAEIVSLHLPATDDTVGILDARRLGLMQPEAVLINTARGNLVDEQALAAALASRRLSAAGLDVFVHEPDVPPALLELDNVVLLPHLGSATEETRTAMGMMAVDNLEAFFGGRAPPHRVV